MTKFAPAALLALAFLMPVQDARAQDPLGGALLGGIGGAVIGGAVGGRGGAAVGAIIGATTGAAIAAQGQARGNGYYYYQNGCYRQTPDGSYVVVGPRYCAVAAVPADDGSAWCAQRYRSYDPVSGTFMGRDGIRRPCP